MQKYAWPAIALHWLMALLVIAMLGLGLYMADLPEGAERSRLIALHKSIGLTLAGLYFARLTWRLSHPPPPYPPSIPEWQRRAAHANAIALYVLLLLQPLTGYLSSSFSGYKTKWFGVPLPYWGWESVPLNAAFNFVHVVGSRLLMILITLHLAGAALHAFVRRDDVVRRMWF
jgi:cytochrome b561